MWGQSVRPGFRVGQVLSYSQLAIISDDNRIGVHCFCVAGYSQFHLAAVCAGKILGRRTVNRYKITCSVFGLYFHSLRLEITVLD